MAIGLKDIEKSKRKPSSQGGPDRAKQNKKRPWSNVDPFIENPLANKAKSIAMRKRGAATTPEKPATTNRPVNHLKHETQNGHYIHEEHEEFREAPGFLKLLKYLVSEL
ncbi:MAG: hypothetical protein HOE90_24245 [Bacteriovoracaceae bacterium]|jgi:hypothetical protein|nr:hypothetical protein [Bacteriovoracaceae bacterium]